MSTDPAKVAAKKWSSMTSRERDAWVAEHVMGWKRENDEQHPGTNQVWFCPPVGQRGENTGITIFATTAPPYTTDASADYLVLKHVRETWGPKRCSAFSSECCYLWSERRSEMHRGLSYSDLVRYEPGDYSYAAYMALMKSKQEQSDE